MKTSDPADTFIVLDDKTIEQCVPMYCSAFNKAPWNDGWTEQAALERLTTFAQFPNSHSMALTTNGQPVAMVFGWGERFTHGWTFLIKEMCVDPKYQRCGKGNRLLKHFELSLVEKNYMSAYLETLETGSSVDFYASLNFRKIPLIMMKKRLR